MTTDVIVEGVIHGKVSTYSHQRCRCRPCKDAKAAQVAEYRARTKKKKAADEKTIAKLNRIKLDNRRSAEPTSSIRVDPTLVEIQKVSPTRGYDFLVKTGTPVALRLTTQDAMRLSKMLTNAIYF